PNASRIPGRYLVIINSGREPGRALAEDRCRQPHFLFDERVNEPRGSAAAQPVPGHPAASTGDHRGVGAVAVPVAKNQCPIWRQSPGGLDYPTDISGRDSNTDGFLEPDLLHRLPKKFDGRVSSNTENIFSSPHT